MTITRATSEQLFALAFQQADSRRRAGGRGHVTLLDKSNVLKSNAFMRAVFNEIAERHPDIETDRLYIDAAAMLMVTQPERFDVVVTENVFGDIVSELAAGISGGLGLAPSADVGADHAVFQPSHGSAPDLAGKDVANPIAMILSAAMMLNWLAERNDDASALAAAQSIHSAVATVLKAGLHTRDLGGAAGTQEVGAAVAAAIVGQN
jgi:3-isopropylmalate dehydrogenase